MPLIILLCFLQESTHYFQLSQCDNELQLDLYQYYTISNSDKMPVIFLTREHTLFSVISV